MIYSQYRAEGNYGCLFNECGVESQIQSFNKKLVICANQELITDLYNFTEGFALSLAIEMNINGRRNAKENDKDKTYN